MLVVAPVVLVVASSWCAVVWLRYMLSSQQPKAIISTDLRAIMRLQGWTKVPGLACVLRLLPAQLTGIIQHTYVTGTRVLVPPLPAEERHNRSRPAASNVVTKVAKHVAHGTIDCSQRCIQCA
jgi:hypothetical protein